MNSSSPEGLTPTQCIRLLAEHRLRWMIPTIVCALLAAAYALVMPRYWQASQALVVRQEASSSESGQLGKFADLYQMRTFQETILELVKSRQVLAATLDFVSHQEQGWEANPADDEQIEALRRRVSMLPPGGAEFGKTEVFYLGVKDKSRERANLLVAELSRQLDIRLRHLRQERAADLSTEIGQQVALAQQSQDHDVSSLKEFEIAVGTDLAELRLLNSANSGQSDLRQQSVQLESESRQIAAKVRDAEQLLAVLKSSQSDPQQLVAMPSSLLTSQPTLRHLKDGLFDAQIRLARVEGTRTKDHPQVIAGHEAIEHIREDLHKELQVAVQGVEVELALNRQRYIGLKDKQRQLDQRLSNVVRQRAEYSELVAAAENSRQVLDQARKQLTAAQAQEAAAFSTRLVSVLDVPDAGTSPVGPRRASVLLLGAVAGLAIGLGWTFLTVTPIPSPAPAIQSSQVSSSTRTAASNGSKTENKYESTPGTVYTPYGADSFSAVANGSARR